MECTKRRYDKQIMCRVISETRWLHGFLLLIHFYSWGCTTQISGPLILCTDVLFPLSLYPLAVASSLVSRSSKWWLSISAA